MSDQTPNHLSNVYNKTTTHPNLVHNQTFRIPKNNRNTRSKSIASNTYTTNTFVQPRTNNQPKYNYNAYTQRPLSMNTSNNYIVNQQIGNPETDENSLHHIQWEIVKTLVEIRIKYIITTMYKCNTKKIINL